MLRFRRHGDGPSFILSSKADAGGIPQKGSYLTGEEEKGGGAERVGESDSERTIGDSKLYIN